MQLALQKYLLQYSPEKLKEEYFIKYKQSEKYPNLYLFSYDQIHSPMNELICQEARGIILDSHSNWEVVSMGFTKFFNFGESKASKLDWDSTKIYTKHDGSLICLYRYNNEWLVSTTGSPDASGKVHDFGFTFADLFWQVFKEKGWKLPEDIPIVGGSLKYTYMFELETPYNRIVVDHKQNNLAFLGARDLNTLKELEPEPVADYYGWEPSKYWSFSSVEAIKEFLTTLNPLEQEGFVLRDSLFNRVKMKSESYVALHHCVNGISKKRMVEVILKNESEECRNMFKLFGNLFEALLNAYGNLCLDCESEFNELNKIKDQKEFALVAKKSKLCGILFNMRTKKQSADYILKSLSSDTVLNLLDNYLEEG